MTESWSQRRGVVLETSERPAPAPNCGLGIGKRETGNRNVFQSAIRNPQLINRAFLYGFLRGQGETRLHSASRGYQLGHVVAEGRTMFEAVARSPANQPHIFHLRMAV